MKSFLIILVCCAFAVAANEFDLEEFKKGNNLFTASIYKELLKIEENNFLVSPLSIETIMALTESGAKSDTAEEIRKGLYFPNTTEQIELIFKQLLPTLQSHELYNLTSANKIYIKTGYKIDDKFQKLATDVYLSEIENIDFDLNVDAAHTINSWVENRTDHKINNLIDPNYLNGLTRVVLVNTLYFSGKWVKKFDSYVTSKENFYKTPTDIIQLDTMHNVEEYKYYECTKLDAKFIELPYEGDHVNMIIVLPNDIDGLERIEKNIDHIIDYLPEFKNERVNVSLPKFTISSQLKIKNILKELGIQKAFTEDADFSGLAGDQGSLFISNVIQKTFINITEAGTEAASATEVLAEAESLPPPPTAEMNIDHPFLFYVTAKSVLVFAGRFIGA